AFLLSYFLSLSEQGLFTNFPLAYATCATELFIATYVVGRTVNTGHMTALVAAWVLPLLAFQYVGWNLIPNTFRAFPHYATIAGVTAVTSASLLLIGRYRTIASVLLGILVFLGITYIVVVAPTLLTLAAPPIAVFGLISLFSARTRTELARKIFVLLAVLT